MKMKFGLSVLMTIVCAVALAVPLKFTTVNDHADLLYRIGEEAVFTVTATDTNGVKATDGVLTAVLDNFGPKTVTTLKVDLAKTNPFVLKGSLDEPGFLRLRVNAKGSAAYNWSVGYEPTAIRKGSPSPDDFDAFWAAARAKLAKEVPLDAQVMPLKERSTKQWNMYRVSFATFGRRVYGYMSVPTDKTKAPYAVDFQVPGAGWGNWSNEMRGDAERIKLLVSVYPFEPRLDWKTKEATALYDGINDAAKQKYGCSGYSQGGITVSREAYFYYPVILGIDRVVDWVAARDDVDPKRFYYRGTSQGGGMGLALTALNHRFTRAVFFVPAMTDTMGYLKGRQSGWPSIIERNSSTPEGKAAAVANAPYFDAANFASRVACPVRVLVGLGDTTCAPCAVYAAYNEIKVDDKDILRGPGMGHRCDRKLHGQLEEWLFR